MFAWLCVIRQDAWDSQQMQSTLLLCRKYQAIYRDLGALFMMMMMMMHAVCRASKITMWKNVNGVYSADPRRVPDAFPIRWKHTFAFVAFCMNVGHCIFQQLPSQLSACNGPHATVRMTVILFHCTIWWIVHLFGLHCQASLLQVEMSSGKAHFALECNKLPIRVFCVCLALARLCWAKVTNTS